MALVGKRKREAKMDNLIGSNPKMLLTVSNLFPPGTTQADLPFQSRDPTAAEAEKGGFPLSLTVSLPGGGEIVGTGWHASRKEAERQCAIDACRQLKTRGLLLLPEDTQPDANTAIAVVAATAAAANANGAATPADMSVGTVAGVKLPWADNPKNVLNASVVFKARNLRREPLPLRVQHVGPDHNRVFEAELDVPATREGMSMGMMWTVRGQGVTKADAERACCIAACSHLFNLGLLEPTSYGGGSSAAPEPQEAWLVLNPDEQTHLQAVLQEFDRNYSPPPSGPNKGPGKYKAAGAKGKGTPGKAGAKDDDTAVANFVGAPMVQDPALDAQYRIEAKRRSTAPEMRERFRARQALPAWLERERIVDMVKKNKVSLVVGETGCGKTTQVPQFILESAEHDGHASAVHILVTQPRRIAAVSVSERVAWERGEEVGKSVGFSIRLESVPPRPRGSVHFVTTGILLRRLQSGEGCLRGVSHIVIDEVHEREMDTDFMLILVREMLAQQPELRIVIMSATVETQLFSSYFSGCPVLTIPGNIFPVEVFYLEDFPRYDLFPASSGLVGRALKALVDSDGAAARDRGGAHDDELDAEVAASTIGWVNSSYRGTDGAILCFLPSWDAIVAVKDRLSGSSSSTRMLIITLHSSVPQAEQRTAFSRPPPGIRKVILSTNIAETSITIDDVVFVVDSGKCKEKTYEPSRDMSAMRVQWTSKASATQRQGRAGRVRAGKCFRLYSRAVYDQMQEHSTPEMQRVSLEEICLEIKTVANSNSAAWPKGSKAAQVFATISSFLAHAPTPPEPRAVRAAITALQQLGAMDHNEDLTPLGETLGRLSVHPRLGKLLVYAVYFRCLDPAIGIVAAASLTREVFLNPLMRREAADAARNRFAIGPASGSDHLTAVAAHYWWRAAWAEGPLQGAGFTEEHFLSGATLRNMTGLKDQITRMLYSANVLQTGDPDFGTTDQSEEALHVARCVLGAGLTPNVARSDNFMELKGGASARPAGWQKPKAKFGFRTQQGRVFIHPTSVLYRLEHDKLLDPRKCHLVVYNEKVQTSQVFIRGCTNVPPIALALFGGPLDYRPSPTPYAGAGMLLLEGWLAFNVDNTTGQLVHHLRSVLDWVLHRWLAGEPRLDHERAVIDCAIRLLAKAGRELSWGNSPSV